MHREEWGWTATIGWGTLLMDLLVGGDPWKHSASLSPPITAQTNASDDRGIAARLTAT
jgi:hypothetical protein